MDPAATGDISEFAIVVAGFTGLVLAIGSREGDTNSIVKLRAVTMLFYAFTAAFGSLLPITVQSFGASNVWEVSSYILVFLLLANIAATFVSSRLLLTPSERDQLRWWVWTLVVVGNSFFAILLVAVLGGVVGLAVAGVFFATLIWQLILSAILFTGLILQA
jgi:hypothetical protein